MVINMSLSLSEQTPTASWIHAKVACACLQTTTTIHEKQTYKGLFYGNRCTFYLVIILFLVCELVNKTEAIVE